MAVAERGLDRRVSKRRSELSDRREHKRRREDRSWGAYIPPLKLAQTVMEDKSSVEYQRLAWDALKKSINGLVNKVSKSNIRNILPELLAENLIRGRGLLVRSLIKSQLASPAFTPVFAALVAVLNTKFPDIGELLLKRLILHFYRAFNLNDKILLLAVAKFIAHLVNQRVAHDVLPLQLLLALLTTPTDDRVEVAVGFITECGSTLLEVSPKCFQTVFDRLRHVLHEGDIDKRVQFMIESVLALRRSHFQGHPAVLPELDLVDEGDQVTHQVPLESDELDPESHPGKQRFNPELFSADVFTPDPDFQENERRYEAIKKSILDGSSEGDDESEAESEEDEEQQDQGVYVEDHTQTDLVSLRRTIYLTFMSSSTFEEAGHKLLKIKLEPGQEKEVCLMILECCSQEKSYRRYYGLLGQRLCLMNRVYQQHFEECFVEYYKTIHRLETEKLRNVARFFAHLLGSDALPWRILTFIRLSEEATTSSSRIFIKILFQEVSEHLGLRKINELLGDPDPEVQKHFGGIFPRDNPRDTRFAINFFTSIGLGGLTDSLREHLKNLPRMIVAQNKPVRNEAPAPMRIVRV